VTGLFSPYILFIFIEQESIEQASSNPVPESHCPAELAQTLIKFNYL